MQSTLSIRAPVALRASCNATPQRMSAPMSSVASIASVRAFAPTRATVPLVSARPTTITAAGRRDDRENDGFQYVVNFAPIPSHTLPHAPRLHVYHRDRVIQVRRVTKVVKGGKQLRFRAVVVVGNENGTVGVGCASAKEVVMAVQKAAEAGGRGQGEGTAARALPPGNRTVVGCTTIFLRQSIHLSFFLATTPQ